MSAHATKVRDLALLRKLSRFRLCHGTDVGTEIVVDDRHLGLCKRTRSECLRQETNS